MPPLSFVRALFFDVFGTLVDWRSGVAREAERSLAPGKASRLDWLAFADAWRGEYQAGMEEVRAGRERLCRYSMSFTAAISTASFRASVSPILRRRSAKNLTLSRGISSMPGRKFPPRSCAYQCKFSHRAPSQTATSRCKSTGWRAATVFGGIRFSVPRRRAITSLSRVSIWRARRRCTCRRSAA